MVTIKKVTKSCFYCVLMIAFIIVLIGAFQSLLSENSGKTFRDVREHIKMPSMTICPFPVCILDNKNLTSLELLYI